MARAGLVLAVVGWSVGPITQAQTAPFGSSGDPLETPFGRFGRGLRATAYVGPAFLGASWWTAASADVEGRVGPVGFGLGGTLHARPGDRYEPATDELYDAVRLVRYARLEPSARFPLYARVGPIERVTLGSGHLVRDYRSTTAWDERTLGAEAAVQSEGVSFGAFVGDVRFWQSRGVAGGFADVVLAPRARGALGTLRLGLGGVHDTGLPLDTTVTGLQAEIAGSVFSVATLALSPYVSYAEYRGYGRSLAVGADFGAPDVLDVARLRLRLAVFANSDGFTPGYVGPFYSISNVTDRIVTAASFFETDSVLAYAGVPLGEVEGGVDVLTQAELLALGSFEFFYHFRRHYGDQPLSDFSLRVALRPSLVEGFRVALGIERQGLDSFFSLFRDLEDQNTLVFDIDYPLRDFLHLSVRSRYGYRRLPADEAGPRLEADPRPDAPLLFLVQRRFEPLIGLRLRL